MSTRGTSRRGSEAARSRAAGAKRSSRRWRAAARALAAAAVAVVAWLALRPRAEVALPGPVGGPSVAQDVNTLAGKPAPAFTLSDSEGKSYAVTPGRGKPLVLVFHTGIV